jgi:hypothetical protein
VTDVVLRCPNCGTTQGLEGECEACHESDVRYFCGNHAPGRWIDAPPCPGCGARLARPGASTPPPASPPRRPEPLAPRPAPPPRATLPPMSRLPVEEPPAWIPPRRPPPVAEPIADGVLVAPPRRGGARRPPDERPELPRRGIPVVGCLVRLVLVVALLAVLAVAALVALLGGMGGVRSWVVDVGQATGVLAGVPEQTARGIAAYERGDAAAAERELREAARLYPRSALAPLYLARLRRAAGDTSRAGEYLQDAVRREPESAAVHRELATHALSLASAAERAGGAPAARPHLVAAERHFARALALDPRDRESYGYYGCTLSGLGRADEAARALAQAGAGPWQACAAPTPAAP